MALNLPTFLALKSLSEKKNTKQDSIVVVEQKNASTESKSRKERMQDWLSPKPEAIQAFPGEKEIFRKGLVLVTDTRLAFIDPFDRMLKTYMFEHMISVHKQFYQPTVFNRRLCKALLILCILAFFIVLTIDFLDSNSSGLFLVYLPILGSMAIGLKVWNDMKPWYVIHWRMSDHTYGEIAQEPMLSERMKADNSREVFMINLANAMNQALSAKAWWPTQGHYANREQLVPETDKPEDSDNNERPDKSERKGSTRLKLVTDNYQ